MLDWLLSFLLEFILPLLAEFLAEALQSFLAPFLYRFRLLFLTPLAGAGFSGLSLLALPHHLIRDPTARLFALLLIPLLVGLCLAGLGLALDRFGRPRTALKRFLPAFVFALCFALVRFRFAA